MGLRPTQTLAYVFLSFSLSPRVEKFDLLSFLFTVQYQIHDNPHWVADMFTVQYQIHDNPHWVADMFTVQYQIHDNPHWVAEMFTVQPPIGAQYISVPGNIIFMAELCLETTYVRSQNVNFYKEKSSV